MGTSAYTSKRQSENINNNIIKLAADENKMINCLNDLSKAITDLKADLKDLHQTQQQTSNKLDYMLIVAVLLLIVLTGGLYL